VSQPAITPAKSKTSFKAIFVLVFMGILCPLVIIEIAAHFAPTLIPDEIRAVFQNRQEQTLKGLIPDATLGYKYAPGLTNFPVPFETGEGQQTYPISTVSLGFKDAGFRDDGLKGEAFGVVVGDSYTSCASVTNAECWVERIEQATGRDMANLGVVGYGPQQEARMLTKYGLPLQPKLVLWVFFANDLNDAWKFDQFGSEAAQEGQFWQNPLKTWLAQHSALFTLGAFFWINRYLFYNLATFDPPTDPRTANLVWWLTNTDLSVPEVAEGLALTKQAMLEARQRFLAQDNTARFVVVILPYREQVYAPATLQPQLDQLNQSLIDFCQQQNIPWIDLTPMLREQASYEPAPLYFRKDIHLNARGNEIVAKLLTQLLQEHLKGSQEK
jgi:hypothetical protein